MGRIDPQPAATGTRADTVRRLADGLGFALLGIAPAEPAQRPEFFRQWLKANRHGEMHYLAEHVEERLDPAQLVPGARSIICVADRYQSTLPADATPVEGAPVGRIARYAWGDDYHRVLKKRLHDLADQLRELFPSDTFRTTVDTAPSFEREHAQRAQLGWQGKHTLLIHPRLGSWFSLGQIITTLALQTEVERVGPIMTDHCGSCTRCIDACPTSCLEPYQIDASRCISYLTLEHRSPIDPALHPMMGQWLAGCDVCQEVCPFNQLASTHEADAPPLHPRYQPRPPAPALPLLQVLDCDAPGRQAMLQSSALKRIKLEMLKRNALIAAGNWLTQHDDPVLRSRIAELAEDESEPQLVQLTARQVLAALSGAEDRSQSLADHDAGADEGDGQ